jgi:hypothetical protein
MSRVMMTWDSPRCGCHWPAQVLAENGELPVDRFAVALELYRMMTTEQN